jgi:hypothetical protein
MGLLGDSGKEGKRTCPNCGKELKKGEGLVKEDGHYCCNSCHKQGPKKEKSKTCEFC